MFSKCANPDCAALFDYHQGQYFRFRNDHLGEAPAMKSHAVQHFWLCERCRETYILKYEERRGVLISFRSKAISRGMARSIAEA